jgi:hypothetical protein
MASLRPLAACLAGMAAVLPVSAHAAVDTEAPRIGARTRNTDAGWELDTSFAGRSYSIQNQSVGALELSGTGERLRAELIDFLAPVHDDGRPYALQPFLQRANAIAVHVDLGHFETNNPFGSPLRTDYDANFGGSVGLYLRPWLNLFGGASYDYDSLSDNLGIASVGSTTHSFFGNVGLGLRVGDALFRAGYYASSQHTSGAPLPFHQGVLLSAFAALASRFTVSLDGETLPEGGDGGLSLEYFTSRNLGIFAGGFAGRGQFYRTGPAVSRYGGSAGVGGWMYGSMELVAEYSFTYESRSPLTPVTPTEPTDVGYHQITHALLLQMNFRIH